MKSYHERVIDEVLEVMKDNLILLYNFNDDSLINIRNYCNDRLHTRYKISFESISLNLEFQTE